MRDRQSALYSASVAVVTPVFDLASAGSLHPAFHPQAELPPFVAMKRIPVSPAAPRKYCKRSRIDRLPQSLQREMRDRCRQGEPLRVICAWLNRRRRNLRVNTQALAQWWKRQQLQSIATTGEAVATHGAFQIIVTAPGADEVRVQVKPLRRKGR